VTDDEVLTVLRRGNEHRAAAAAAFAEAYEGAETDVAKCWAAHMVAVVEDGPEEKLRWNLESLRAADAAAAAGDERAAGLYPTCLANTGLSELFLARPAAARERYAAALAALDLTDLDDQRRAGYRAAIEHMLGVIDAVP